MERKAVSGIMLTLLLIGMLTLAFNTQPAKAEYEFKDDFDSGLVQWNNFGYPTPTTFQDPSFEDGWGYSTEGDSWHLSGSWSKQLLDISNGIIIEFRVKQEAGNVWDYFGIIGIGRLQSGYTEIYGEAYFGVTISGPASEFIDDITYQTRTASYTEDAANDHAFHIFKLVYDGLTNDVEFYKDDNFVVALNAGPRPFNELPVYVIGRDYHNTNYLDWIRVSVPTPPVVTATVDIDPDTLNLKSNGEWITTYIEVPGGYSVEAIDVPTILLNDTISVDPEAPTQLGDYDTDGVPDLMVKFDRAAVIAWLGTVDFSEDTGKSVEVTLVITGEVAGTPFEGADTIRVLSKG